MGVGLGMQTEVWVGRMCLKKDGIEYETGGCQSVHFPEINTVLHYSPSVLFDNTVAKK